MDHRKIGWDVLDWVHLAEDRGQWWALVNTVGKVISCLAEWLLASQERLCYMVLLVTAIISV
jgi:hypothetical protein